MKITTKGRYAIHILYDLAVNGTEHPVSVKEMATRQEISVKYMDFFHYLYALAFSITGSEHRSK